MKLKFILLYPLWLLCFMATAVPSYGYNEQFVIDGIRYFHLGYGRCQAIGLTDTTEVVRIPDMVYDESHPYRVTEINFGVGLPLRNGVVYCPYWLEYIWPESFRLKDLVAIYFQENDSIEEFKIGGNTFVHTHLREINFPSNYKRVMNSTFFGCDSLRSIGWSENIWSIEQWAFYQCSSLREVRLPDKVESVHFEAFKYCPLDTVWLSRSLKNISDGAFNTCNLVDVQHVYAPTGRLAACSVIKTGYNQSFQGQNGVVVHVPVGTIDLFEDSEGWSSYELQEDAALGEQHKILLTVNDADSGIVTLEGAEFYKDRRWVVEHGKPVTIKAIPQGNCELRCCIINGIDVSDRFDSEGRYTIDEVNENSEIYISFNSITTFTPFSIRQAGSGHIDLQVYHDEPLTRTITPDKGWVINSVTINGIDITKKLDGNGDFTIYKVDGGIVVGSGPSCVPIGPAKAGSVATEEVKTFVAFEKHSEAVDELFSTGSIKVYGSEGQLRIEGVAQGEVVRVYDTAGRQVAKSTGTGNSLTINVPSGIYLVQSGNTTIKIII